MFPCLNLLLPAFYLREELAKRTAMIFGASAISSAFGGLFAYGILCVFLLGPWDCAKTDGSGPPARWMVWADMPVGDGSTFCPYLASVIVARTPRSPHASRSVLYSEGILSVLIATLMFFILPDNPSQAWFLTPEERELATKRIAKVKLYHGAGPLDWSEVRRAFKDWKLYVRCARPSYSATAGSGPLTWAR